MYSQQQPAQELQPLLRHRQVEAYSQVVNSKTYIIQSQDGLERVSESVGGGAAGGGGGGGGERGAIPPQPRSMSAGRRTLSATAAAAAATGAAGQRPLSKNPAIVKKNWPSQQTKSLTRKKVQESFNSNYFITGSGNGNGPVTISKNVTNVHRTESAWDTGASDGRWPPSQQQQQQSWSEDGGVFSSEVPVYSASGGGGGGSVVGGQTVLLNNINNNNNYGDGMSRGTNDFEGSLVRGNGVRVESAWSPYGISGTSGVHGMESVSNNSYKKNRVGPSVNNDNNHLNSAESKGRRNFTRINGNNSNSSQSNRSKIGYSEGGGQLAKTTSAAAGLGGGSGADIATDFWSNYGES